ncbi:hypothetical protein D0Z00_000847 [Geotrichum galactomycetum]|uniref:Uncharacterized protein n=1 Tax=Geotrichum galactomycetum TaxID=27317 RepID=A0ACB6V8U8_9ASCO|nr:hypothetical protein D0Z00_000847 [Geotrichum candidum]
MISSLDNLSPEKLRQELDFEQSENQILSRQLNDTKLKLSAALNVQSQLELDLVDMTKQVAILQGQVKDLKKSKNQLENELSREQMNYINEKQQWLDKEAKTEVVVDNLRSELSKATAANPSLPSTPSSFSFPGTFSSASTATTAATSTTSSTSSSGGFGHRRLLSITSLSSNRSNNNNTNSADSKTVEKLKSELEQARQQADFVSKEYTARFDQIETELQHSKAQVARLIEENEGFQFLLVEKAILSGLDEETEETDQLCEEDKRSLESEVKLTKSHNKALTTSLERLIQRLLESKDFERTLEENTMSGNINAKTLSAFSSRVLGNNNQSNSTSSSSRPAFNRGHHSGRGSVSSMFSISSGLRRNPSVWTSLILGAGATGAADDHHSVSDGTTTTDSVNSSRPNSPVANGLMSSDSSISSIDTTTLVNSPTAASGGANQLNALLNGSVVARRPSTTSQKKLRPLTMAN